MCWRHGEPLHAPRRVVVNARREDRDGAFPPNSAISSRYTAWNFVPLFLFASFTHGASNAYFLAICILQAIPAISITNGVPTTAVPLAAILAFDGIIVAREDYSRHVDDDRENATPVLRGNVLTRDFDTVRWVDLHVGDVVKVRLGERFPADLVFLAAVGGHNDPELRSLCYVQTANLDGETTLKLRHSHDRVWPRFRTDADAAGWRDAVCECEPPNPLFTSFEGKLFMDGEGGEGVPLDASNLLLRGCVLRNCVAVYALVVMTGRDTKVRVHQSSPPRKVGRIESEVNVAVACLFCLQLSLCLAGSIGFWIGGGESGVWYLEGVNDSGVALFFTYFLLLSFLIPISLVVSMRFVRIVASRLMEHDVEMVHVDEGALGATGGEGGVFPLRVRTMDLNDELGRVTDVFADKTGTLTRNDMEFKKFIVGGIVYGRGTTAVGLRRREGAAAPPQARRSPALPHVNFEDGVGEGEDRLLLGPQGDLTGSGAGRDASQTMRLRLLLLSLAVNHTVLVETSRDPETGDEIGTSLSASSPDEEAFVQAASFFGLRFSARTQDHVSLQPSPALRLGAPGEARFRLVALLPYTSARKMMSLIVEDLQVAERVRLGTGGDVGELLQPHHFLLLTKGADVRVLPRCALPASSDPAMQRAMEAADEWSSDGLRTLMWAWRPLDEGQLVDWVPRYTAALGQQRGQADGGGDGAVSALQDEMESSLRLLGCTANEDLLQEGVPEEIAALSSAGIRIYVLTGDKVGTAMNIASSCNLIRPGYEQLVFTAEQDDLPARMLDAAARLTRVAAGAATAAKVLVLDELAIDVLVARGTPRIRAAVAAVAAASATTLCCRCRPDQKRLMVSLIRNHDPDKCCLAIGDGANDVDMLHAAHIGVGVTGPEGLAAANAADFSLGQFRFLTRLLLLHGGWNFARMTLLVRFSLWKNIVFALAQVPSVPVTLWSGQRIILDTLLQVFNLCFTAVPILVASTIDKPIPARAALALPQLYVDSVAARPLRPTALLYLIVEGVWCGVMIFLVIYWGLSVASTAGAVPFVFEFGTPVFNSVVVCASMRVALQATTHSALFATSILASLALLPAFEWTLDAMNEDNCNGCMQRVYGLGPYYAAVPLAVVCGLSLFSSIHLYTTHFRPSYSQLVREWDVLCTAAGAKPTFYQRLLTPCQRRVKETMRPSPSVHFAGTDYAGPLGVIAASSVHDLLLPGRDADVHKPSVVGIAAAALTSAIVRCAAALHCVSRPPPIYDFRPVGSAGPQPHAQPLFPAPLLRLPPQPKRTPGLPLPPIHCAEDVETDLSQWPHAMRILSLLVAQAKAGAQLEQLEEARARLLVSALEERREAIPLEAPPGARVSTSDFSQEGAGGASSTLAWHLSSVGRALGRRGRAAIGGTWAGEPGPAREGSSQS